MHKIMNKSELNKLMTQAYNERLIRNKKIRAEYASLISIKGAMPTAVREYLADKYNLSVTTIYNINRPDSNEDL